MESNTVRAFDSTKFALSTSFLSSTFGTDTEDTQPSRYSDKNTYSADAAPGTVSPQGKSNGNVTL